jgi:hypothetical protein
MTKPAKHSYIFENLTISTVLWLMQVAKDTGVIIESVCWYNKRNPDIKLHNVMIKDPDEAYLAKVTLSCENKKKLLFVNHLFYKRKDSILSLYHCYNKQGEQK